MTENTLSIVVKYFGSYDALSVQDHPLPPLEGKVEVEVEYGGLNFADLYNRMGLIKQKIFPFVSGLECTGTITNMGLTTKNFKVGDRVICYDYRGGLHSRKIRVSEDKCYLLPADVPLDTGAALFVNYQTAYFSLFHLGNLKKRETVLILSCGGGVGCAATQLAKTIEGVKIVGTTSPGKEDQVKENGVDDLIRLDSDFKKNLEEKYAKKFDVILCNQAGSLFNYLQSQLRPLGRIVLLGANNIVENDKKLSYLSLIKCWFGIKKVELSDLLHNSRVVAALHLGLLAESEPEKVQQVLTVLFEFLREGKIKPKVCSIYAMEDIVEATKMLADRKNVGKILISML